VRGQNQEDLSRLSLAEACLQGARPRAVTPAQSESGHEGATAVGNGHQLTG